MITMSLSEAQQFLHELRQFIEHLGIIQGEEFETKIVIDYDERGPIVRGNIYRGQGGSR